MLFRPARHARQDVSIHAPAQGATAATQKNHLAYQVSIHAPAQGATAASLWFVVLTPVSIHAPAQGATRPGSRDRPPSRSFNPRTRAGCDNIQAGFLDGLTSFQSTHPRRVRPAVAVSPAKPIEFQSTHPRRVRHSGPTGDSWIWAFQSTHPRRVRLAVLPTTPAAKSTFQSTHPRRVRRIFCARSSHQIWFQSTHPRRVRLSVHSFGHIHWCFNPRTRAGCDPAPWSNDRASHCFNPRTRAGCDARAEAVMTINTQFQSTHPRRVRR